MALRGKSMRRSRKMRRGMGMARLRTMRRNLMMRGGDIANAGTVSGTSSGDPEATNVASSVISGEGPAVSQGYSPPAFNPNVPINSSESMTGGRRRRRHSMRMRGGNHMELPSTGSQRVMYDGGRRRRNRSRRGGSVLATAAVPFGIWGLQRYMSKSRSSGSGSDKGSRRRGRRRRY